MAKQDKGKEVTRSLLLQAQRIEASGSKKNHEYGHPLRGTLPIRSKHPLRAGPLTPPSLAGGRPKSMVWQYYTKVGNADEKSKRCEVHCNACQARFQSRVEIMEAHLAQTCKAAAEELKHMMRERIRHKAEDRARKEQAANEIKAAAPVPALPSALAVPLPQAKRFKPEEGRAVETMIPLRLRFPQASTFLTLGLNMRGELARLCCTVR